MALISKVVSPWVGNVLRPAIETRAMNMRSAGSCNGTTGTGSVQPTMSRASSNRSMRMAACLARCRLAARCRCIKTVRPGEVHMAVFIRASSEGRYQGSISDAYDFMSRQRAAQQGDEDRQGGAGAQGEMGSGA